MNNTAVRVLPSAATSRRAFLKTSAFAALGFPAIVRAAANTPRRLRVGLVGTGGRGVNTCRDMAGLAEIVDVIAMADVDPGRGAAGAKVIRACFPGARQYLDYRRLFDAEKTLEAVVVTTPDHMHAPISLLAMARGLHVFCEKPLTRTVWEARRMRQAAATAGVVTQMGTQWAASSDVRRGAELLRAGALGDITELHIWTDRTPRLPGPKDAAKTLPDGMDWDGWLGVAARTEFSPRYHPHRWRWWTPYGAGALGDMGCHMTHLAFRGLDLFAPSEVRVDKIGAIPAPGMFPRKTKLTYKFPANASRKALDLVWYDGGETPDADFLRQFGLKEMAGGGLPPKEGKLIVGTKGVMWNHYLKLHGEQRFFGFNNHPVSKSVPVTLPRLKEQGTSGHYREWVEAALGGPEKTFCGFDVGARQTEMVLLGTVAQQLGKNIRWDAAKMEIPGEPAAAALLKPAYRPGWTV